MLPVSLLSELNKFLRLVKLQFFLDHKQRDDVLFVLITEGGVESPHLN